MASITAIASELLSQSTARAEIAGRNIVNATTAGYHREIVFSRLVEGVAAAEAAPLETARDMSSGKLGVTGNPGDLAIEGPGYFVVRSDQGLFYTRYGAFHHADGHLVDAEGRVLQAADGGDLAIRDGDWTISSEGQLSSDGIPAGRVAVVVFDDESVLSAHGGQLFAGPGDAARPVDRPQIRQGMIEGSNVNTGDEMVRLMAALRSAETGQRLIQAYDELMGRALSAFGGN